MKNMIAGETNYFYSGDDFVQLGKLADLPSTSFSVDVEKETANGIEISVSHFFYSIEFCRY